MVFALVLSAVCLVSGATSKTEVSPVQKVVELLDELKGKVEGELATEESLMEEYSKWCDSEANTKEDAITSGTRTVKDADAVISESSANIATLTSEIEELAAKVSSADSDLKKATEIRATERTDFEATEKDLVETIDTLGRAHIVLSRGQTSFLQKGSKDIRMLTDGLSKIIEATWVNSRQKAMVQSLIQSTSESEDEDLSLQPQATTAAYESKGQGILDTIQDMKEKAESTLSGLRKDEMSSNHAFEMLKQSLEDELATMNARKSAATSERASAEETKAAAEGERSSTQATVDADTEYLANLRNDCAAKAAEWDARQKSAADEMGAIAKAKSILEEGVKVFLQVGSDDIEARNRVAAIMRKLATKDHGFELAQLASAASSDPFGKVRGLIESMIDRLTREAAEEADAKSFCDSETSKTRAKQEELTATLDKHAVRIEKGEATKAELAAQIRKLNEEIATMDKGQSEATSIRTKEHDEYVKASKDYKDSATAVAKAIEVLSAYYNKGSFLQVSAKVGQAPEFGGAKSDIAGTIMSILEVAESDFTRLLAESEAQESAAQESYDRLTQENTVAKAAATKEIEGKEGETKSLENSLNNYRADHAETSKELDATLAYLDKLKPQCETKVMSYAERKARREEEIAGLKEALEILSK